MTGPLRRELEEQHHTFDFFQGDFDCEPPPGVDQIYKGPYKTWYRPHIDAASHRQAKELVLDIIENDGPFDAVMAFSQGAALISTMMLERRKSQPFAPLWFQLAIFICAGCPLVVDGDEDEDEDEQGDKDNKINTRSSWRRMDIASLPSNHRINIPTVHILGKKDDTLPDCLRLRDACDPRSRFVYDHGGAHDIPRKPVTTKEMAQIIRKAIDRARTFS
ncbi:MAG: hypothetical protein Q9227_007468 [Pyrenula ochraceoflavens]